MHGRQYEMAGQRRLHRNLRGFEITDLADHNDVGILPQDRAQQAGKIEADLRLDLDLVDPCELVFDRVLDGHDIAGDRVQLEEPGVERRRLAAPCRARDQHHAVRQLEGVFDALPDIRRQPELLVIELDGGAVEHAKHDFLAVQRGYRGDPEVYLVAAHGQLDAPVLRQTALGDIEPRHDLDTRDDRRLQPRRRRLHLVQ